MADKFEIEIISGSSEGGGKTPEQIEKMRDDRRLKVARERRATESSERAKSASDRSQVKFEQQQEDRTQKKKDKADQTRKKETDAVLKDQKKSDNEKKKEREKQVKDRTKAAKDRRVQHEREIRDKSRAARNISAEDSKSQIMRRRFINNMFGAFNRAHLGRRINHGIDFIKSIFGGGGGSPLSEGGKSSSRIFLSPRGGAGGKGGAGGIGGQGGGLFPSKTPKGLAFPSPAAAGAGGAAGAAGGTSKFAGIISKAGPIGLGVAALTAVVAGAVTGFILLNRHVKRFAATLDGIPSELTFARLETNLMIFEKRLQRGQEFGRDLAIIERQRGQRISAMMSLNDTFTDAFMPLVIQGNKLLTGILASTSKGLEAILILLSPFIDFLATQLSSLTDIGGGLVKTGSNVIPILSGLLDIAELLKDKDREKELGSTARVLFEFLQNPTVLADPNAIIEFGFGDI